MRAFPWISCFLFFFLLCLVGKYLKIRHFLLFVPLIKKALYPANHLKKRYKSFLTYEVIGEMLVEKKLNPTS